MKRWGAAWRWLRRVPVVTAAGTFTATCTSTIHAFVIGLAVVTLFEAPVLHLLFHRARVGAHLLIALINVYTWVWLFGERRLLQESAHRLGVNALEIALGSSWRGAIPYAQIVAARRVDGTRRRPGVLRVTPIDAPNVELTLAEPVTLQGSLGLPRRSARVQLYVDDADALIAALTARRPLK